MLTLWNIGLGIILLLFWPILVLWALIGRHHLLCRLGLVPASDGPRVWIHSASVGEAGVAGNLRKLVASIKPDSRFFFTATTRTGVARLKSLASEEDIVCALPVDFRPFVRIALRRIRPEALIIVETELWPTLIINTHRLGVPIILANGRIGGSTLRWAERFPLTFRGITDRIDRFLMKSTHDANNLISAGVPPDRIEIPGNLKFGGVSGQVEPAQIDRRPLIVAGSVRPKELDTVIGAFEKVLSRFPGALLVCAPRHLKTSRSMVSIIESRGLKTVSRSRDESPGDSQVYFLDTLGELLGFYAAADVTFVGGTLADYGGHNPLEPAYFARPVLFGPHFDANREAYEALLKTGGGKRINDEDEMANAIIELLENGDARKEVGAAAREAVDRMREIPDRYRAVLREYFTEK